MQQVTIKGVRVKKWDKGDTERALAYSSRRNNLLPVQSELQAQGYETNIGEFAVGTYYIEATRQKAESQ